MKVKLVPRHPRRHGRPDKQTKNHRYGKPYAVNPRGILIHRVSGISTHYYDNGKVSHHCVQFWCGNGCNGIELDSLTDDPPKDRLLCEACERMAVMRKQPTSKKLTGRHVHVGRLRAFRTCCPTENN